MPKFAIRSRWTRDVIFASEAAESMREVVLAAISTRADLADADLAGADLADADLTGAVLTRADLTGADLTRADLTGADLTGADLTVAVLAGAVLAGADLTGAVITGADLVKRVQELLRQAQPASGFAVHVQGPDVLFATPHLEGWRWNRLSARDARMLAKLLGDAAEQLLAGEGTE